MKYFIWVIGSDWDQVIRILAKFFFFVCLCPDLNLHMIDNLLALVFDLFLACFGGSLVKCMYLLTLI